MAGTSADRTELGDFTPIASTGTGSSPSGFSLQNETAAKGHHHKDYSLDNPVYHSRRLFDEAAFLKRLRSGFPGLTRAKGFYWTTRLTKRVSLLSIAGKILRADYITDRRQELVFIGIDLDNKSLIGRLRACEV